MEQKSNRYEKSAGAEERDKNRDGVSWKGPVLSAKVRGELETVITQVTAELKAEGFGILSRIDLHQKFKEKLGEDIPPLVILGACKPSLAYEAFKMNPHVAGLLPCNVVVRQLSSDECAVETVRPTDLLGVLGDSKLTDQAREADDGLAGSIRGLAGAEGGAETVH